MFDLFRFMMIRPAQKANQRGQSPWRVGSRLLEALTRARGASGSRALMKRVASEYIQGQDYLREDQTLPMEASLQAFAAQVSQMTISSRSKLAAVVESTFGVDPVKLLTDSTFANDRERVFDSLIAALLTPSEHRTNLDRLARLGRLFALVEWVGLSEGDPEEEIQVQQALLQTLVLPEEIFPRPTMSSPEGSAPGTLPGPVVDDSALQALELKAQRLEGALHALLTLEAHDFLQPEPQVGLDPNEGQTRSVTGSETSPSEASPRLLAPVSPSPVLQIRTDALRRLGANVTKTLKEIGIDLKRVAVPLAAARLEAELARTATAKAALLPATPASYVIKVGNQLVQVVPPTAIPYKSGPSGGPSDHPDQPFPEPYLPFNGIKSVGIADLLVVRQHLKRYEPGEVSHIENVLKSEERHRDHRRTQRTEEFVMQETEISQEDQKDLQSTERFELKREVENTIQNDFSIKAGVAVSGKYGPSVEFKTNLDVANNHTEKDSTKQATTFSKDVTQRAVSKVINKVHEQHSLRRTEEVEELNKHGFDNTLGAEHVIGVYQWVDKVYEAQVFNYGKRMLFDVMVPEPAAFLLESLQAPSSEQQKLVKPIPFTLRPDQLTTSNYHDYVKKYGVTGAAAPPKAYVTLSKAFDDRAYDIKQSAVTKSAELIVPAGYKATFGRVVTAFTIWDDTAWISVLLGKHGHVWTSAYIGPSGWDVALDGEVDTIPVGYHTHRTGVFAITVEIHCARTDDAIAAWQLNTHAAILQAYQKLLSDYEQQVAQLQMEQAGNLPDRNPETNRQLEKTELRKACLSILTLQQFDQFNAVEKSMQGYPQVNLAEAGKEGRFIRFFEQAFEWEQMMYLFYPYFWGRKGNWPHRILLGDTDPRFAEFLKAGSGRVVLPVRPGFEPAVAHFLLTGDVWEGGNLPDVSSPLYVSIIEEIKERDKAPGAEIAEGDPWDVKLPTELVKLRADATLPEWQKDANGNWLPA
jgi:hypothetical protein